MGFLSGCLALAGLVLLIWPDILWEFRRWQMDGDAEPSKLYLLSNRIGGVICMVIGVSNIVVRIVLHYTR